MTYCKLWKSPNWRRNQYFSPRVAMDGRRPTGIHMLGFRARNPLEWYEIYQSAETATALSENMCIPAGAGRHERLLQNCTCTSPWRGASHEREAWTRHEWASGFNYGLMYQQLTLQQLALNASADTRGGRIPARRGSLHNTNERERGWYWRPGEYAGSGDYWQPFCRRVDADLWP